MVLAWNQQEAAVVLHIFLFDLRGSLNRNFYRIAHVTDLTLVAVSRQADYVKRGLVLIALAGKRNLGTGDNQRNRNVKFIVRDAKISSTHVERKIGCRQV